MKGVFVIIDGVADKPCSALRGKTPLEYAKTPNLDELAEKSRIDYCYTVKEGVAPESSPAIVSLLGSDTNFVPRGPLEARGVGVKLKNGDLAFRCNFATIDNLDDLNILDRRAGRTLTTAEAKILAKAVNERVNLPFKFKFYPSIQHRGVLVIRGGFSDNISNVDPAYEGGMVSSRSGMKVASSEPLDDEDDSKLSAELINSFTRQSFRVLEKHPINIARAKKGLAPANIILSRDAGSSPIRLEKLKGKWMGLGYMPLEIGICESAGMSVYKFKYPELKGKDVYSNLYEGLEEAIKKAKRMLELHKNKYDYFYIHFKETDVPGHDGRVLDKVKMIEKLDKKFFFYLKKIIENARLIVTADHSTPCALKAHSADPVPVLIYPSNLKSKHRFIEKDSLKGKKLYGRNLLKSTLFSE